MAEPRNRPAKWIAPKGAEAGPAPRDEDPVTGIWPRVQALKGTSIPTPGGRSRFEVVSVDDEWITVRPFSRRRKEHLLGRWKIERGYRTGLRGEDLTAEGLHRADPTLKGNLFYTIAILRFLTDEPADRPPPKPGRT